jgi:hypothetical protein
MHQPINFPDPQRIEYAELRRMRQELIWSVPITDQRITELDTHLIEHPLTSLPLLFEIYYRLLYVGAVIYEFGASPDEKRRMLLSLREHYHEFRRMPEPIQEILQHMWLEWVDVLQCEEEELGRKAHG